MIINNDTISYNPHKSAALAAEQTKDYKNAQYFYLKLGEIKKAYQMQKLFTIEQRSKSATKKFKEKIFSK
jgi:hypothetical protein